MPVALSGLLHHPDDSGMRCSAPGQVQQRHRTDYRIPRPANTGKRYFLRIGAYGWINTYYYPGWPVIAILIVAVSLAMTARFKMFSLKFKNLDFAENFCRYIIIVAAIVFLVMYGLAGPMWTILLYLLLSLMRRNRM